MKCPLCGKLFSEEEFLHSGGVCPACGFHLRLSVEQRISLTCDRWNSLSPELEYLKDPLEFKDRYHYEERVERERRKTGRESAIELGRCWAGDVDFMMGIFDFDFMGGTMGIVVGERIRYLFESAMREKKAVVIFFSSGGARMQEGLFSLMQMAKVTVVVDEFKSRCRKPFISVITHPTTGGVLASIVYQADIVIAEPGADVGFTGKRVIRKLYRRRIPSDFQKAERTLALGYLDDVVDRRELKDYLVKVVEFLSDG